MNPFVVFLLAISGIFSIVIYLNVNERSSQNIEINQVKSELDRKEFDRDFNNFLNGDRLHNQDESELAELKQKITEMTEKKRIKDLENEEQLKEMKIKLNEIGRGNT